MKTLLGIAILVTIALVTWWSVSSRNNQDTTLVGNKNQPYLEVFINDFRIISINADGQTDYTLKGLHLERFNNSDDATISQPVIRLLQPGNQWLITADKAIINQKKNMITLNENVIMQQQNQPDALVISSSTMNINTAIQTAFTDSGVMIKQGISEMHARSMLFNNIENQLKLDTDVHGFYLDTLQPTD